MHGVWGTMESRVLKIFTDEDIAKISDTVHSWKSGDGYEDVPGFCKSASLEEVEKNGFVLTPGRYVGADLSELSAEDFHEKFLSLQKNLTEFKEQSSVLDKQIEHALKVLSNE